MRDVGGGGAVIFEAGAQHAGLRIGAGVFVDVFRREDPGDRLADHVGLGPAGEVELGAPRQKVEAGLGEGGTALARQHCVEFRLEVMQVEHVRRSVFDLGRGEFRGAPV